MVMMMPVNGDDGAWPFLVSGAICLVNSDNEQDSSTLTSYAAPCKVNKNPTFTLLSERGIFKHKNW